MSFQVLESKLKIKSLKFKVEWSRLKYCEITAK